MCEHDYLVARSTDRSDKINKETCNKCKYFRNVVVGDSFIGWCFQHNSCINSIRDGYDCSFYQGQVLPISSDEMTESKLRVRNRQVRDYCRKFRFGYETIDGISFITSRYDNWCIIWKDNKNYLYHKNYLGDLSEYGYHYQNKTFLILNDLFNYINAHDYNTLRRTQEKSIPLRGNMFE